MNSLQHADGILKPEYGLDSVLVNVAQAVTATRQAIQLYNYKQPTFCWTIVNRLKDQRDLFHFHAGSHLQLYLYLTVHFGCAQYRQPVHSRPQRAGRINRDDVAAFLRGDAGKG